MTTSVLVGTVEGLRRLGPAGGDSVEALAGHSVTGLARGADGSRWALVDGAAVWRADDGTWEPVATIDGPAATCLIVSGDDVYVGTAEAHVLRVRSRSVERLAGFEEADGRDGWYTPWGGPPDTRSLTAGNDGTLYANVHVGGILRSSDGGETREDHRPGAQRDVHSLAWHSTVAGRAYEAGGGGAAWSDDGGSTWRAADEGRDRHYTWAVAVDPVDPDVWYVSASTGPFAAHGSGDPRARIYRASNGSWQALAGGLPEPLQAMPYALLATGDRLFAGFGDGHLWQSGNRGDTWERCSLREPLERVIALAPVGASVR